MTVFFKSQIPEQLKAIRTEFELALLKQKQEFDAQIAALDRDVEQMENALLARITEAEKMARSNSLPSDGKSDDGQVSNGFKSWTQRKAERVLKAGDPDFVAKTLKRSQRSIAKEN
jgi:hypothetical protein